MNLTVPDVRTVAVPYLAANNLASKEPVYYVKFGLVTGPFGTSSQVLPDQYSTGPIQNETQSRKRYMNRPSGVQNEIDIATGKSTISSITFTLLDIGGDISRICTNYTMKNRLVTVYEGYEGIDEADFNPVYSGQINNWTRTSDGTAYTFTVTDALKQLTTKILNGKTQLTADYKPGDSTISVTNTDKFADASDLYDGMDARNYLRLNDSVFSYTGKTEKSFNGVALVAQLSNGQPQAETIQAGADVVNFVLYQGNPVTLMLQIILSTGDGTNYSGTGTNYDVLPANQGIGVPYTLINVTNFETQRDRFVAWMYFSGYFFKDEDCLKFLEKHFFQQLCCYLFINKSGQLDIKLFYYPLPTLDTVTLDDSNIIGVPQMDANLQTGNAFFNEIDVKWDYQPVPDFYVNEQITDQLTSQQQFEEISIMEIEAQFVKTRYNGFRIVDRMTNIMLKRFAFPLPIFTVECFYMEHLINPGDTVILDSSVVPSFLSGRFEGSITCECIVSAPDFENGKTRLTLLGTGALSNKRYAVIGPANMPNYTSASDAQKRYCFISQLATGNSNVGYMSNGDDGYYIPG